MRDKLRLHMLLHATCSHREVEPRFIRVWLQGPVLQDAAAANRRRCVRNALTNVAEQEHEDGKTAEQPNAWKKDAGTVNTMYSTHRPSFTAPSQ